MTTYERYEKIRNDLGYSDADVSRATGVSKPTLSSWRHGNYTPKADKIEKIATFLGVSFYDIIDRPMTVAEKSLDDESLYYLRLLRRGIVKDLVDAANGCPDEVIRAAITVLELASPEKKKDASAS